MMKWDSMPRYVGLFRRLDDDEHPIVENNFLTPTIFKKEVQVKKLIGHEQKVVPVSCLMTNIHLTNRRLMFLIIREIEAIRLRKKGVPTLSGLEGSWYELPLSSIKSVEAIHKDIRKDRELRDIIPSLSDQRTLSIVEITYDGRRTSGNFRDYMESMFDAEGLTRIYNLKDAVELANKVQLIGEQNVGLAPKIKRMIT